MGKAEFIFLRSTINPRYLDTDIASLIVHCTDWKKGLHEESFWECVSPTAVVGYDGLN